MIYKLVTFKLSFIISIVRLLFLDGLKCKSKYESQKTENFHSWNPSPPFKEN